MALNACPGKHTHTPLVVAGWVWLLMASAWVERKYETGVVAGVAGAAPYGGTTHSKHAFSEGLRADAPPCHMPRRRHGRAAQAPHRNTWPAKLAFHSLQDLGIGGQQQQPVQIGPCCTVGRARMRLSWWRQA